MKHFITSWRFLAGSKDYQLPELCANTSAKGVPQMCGANEDTYV